MADVAGAAATFPPENSSVRIHALSLLAFSATALQAIDCPGVSSLRLSSATVTSAQLIAAGAPQPGQNSARINADFCRVAITAKPSADSDIRIEVWMPATGWNGKFQGVGNGGFAGAIDYSSLASAVSHGYATAATDTGHQAGSTDASWALKHPERVVDFGYRAVHQAAVIAKTILAEYYGKPPARSYFNGCSNGGRQALMEAQRYPEDYDGIAAGAPANFWTHLLTNAVYLMQVLADPASEITKAKLPAIEHAVLKACDAKDGITDRIIENPLACKFDPTVLLCKGPESDSCLTAPQVSALRKIYRGAQTRNGKGIFPGYSPGGEAEPLGWGDWITGSRGQPSLLYSFGTNFFKYIVYSNPDWDLKDFDVDRDLVAADREAASTLNATDPDLKRFAGRGGKLILYHGWNDAAISAQNTVDYYGSISSTMGKAQTNTFARLFMVPGWGHCGGGARPMSFGQSSVPRADSDHDLEAALERWVEQKVAPERIFVGQGILCAFPLVSHWTGSGDTTDAKNFTCAQP